MEPKQIPGRVWIPGMEVSVNISISYMDELFFNYYSKCVMCYYIPWFGVTIQIYTTFSYLCLDYVVPIGLVTGMFIFFLIIFLTRKLIIATEVVREQQQGSFCCLQ